MKIYLDDIRNAPDDTWTVCRTAEEASDLLKLMGEAVEEMSFDHDLGYERTTGYDLACWMERDASEGRWDRVPPKLQVHSANPVGRKNIQAAIDSIERMRPSEA
jgi:hypothetical protein